MDPLSFLCCGGWLIFGFLGAVIGSPKQAASTGFLLGLLFGPFGTIAAFALDNRPKCPACHGRLNGPAQVCQHCRAALIWEWRRGYTEAQWENVSQWRRKRNAERVARFRGFVVWSDRQRERLGRLIRWTGASLAAVPGQMVALTRGLDRWLWRILGEDAGLLVRFFELLIFAAVVGTCGVALGALAATIVGAWLPAQ